MMTGLRRFRRSVVSSGLIVMVAGLTIGLTTIVTSIAEALMLYSVPYDHPEQLVLIDHLPIFDFAESSSAYREWKSQSTLLKDSSMFVVSKVNIFGPSDPLNVSAAQVSPNIFRLLGVKMLRGRGFVDQEAEPGTNLVAVISSKLWNGHFGARQDICGKEVRLNGLTFTIVGVLEAGSAFPAGVDLWTPTIHDIAILERFSATGRFVLGRLKPSATVRLADVQQQSWYRQSKYNNSGAATAIPQHSEVMARSLREELSGPFGTSVKLLAVAVVCVLVVGCTNVAFIILSRLESRRHEFYIKNALGSSISRMFTELLSEHVVLSIVGAGLGILLCGLCIYNSEFILPSDWPAHATLRLNFLVLLSALLCTIIFVLLSGLGPCLQMTFSSGATADILRGGERQSQTLGQKRAGQMIVFIQIALTTVLLEGAAGTIQVASRLYKTPLGFSVEGITTATLSQPETSGTSLNVDTRADFLAPIGTLQSIPGVKAVSGVDILPLRSKTIPFYTVRELSGAIKAVAARRIVTPGYFSALRIPLLAGDDFSALDDEKRDPITIVNQHLARELWPRQPAVGKMLIDERSKYRVVGVVGNTRTFGPLSNATGEYYVPLSQKAPSQAFTYLVVPYSTDLNISSDVRIKMREIAPLQVIEEIVEMRQYLRFVLQTPLMLASVMTVLSLVSSAIAGCGIFGIVTYAILQTRREIAIRWALGAPMSTLIMHIIRGSAHASIAGVICGSFVFLAAYRAAGSYIHDILHSSFSMILTVSLGCLSAALIVSILAANAIAQVIARATAGTDLRGG